MSTSRRQDAQEEIWDDELELKAQCDELDDNLEAISEGRRERVHFTMSGGLRNTKFKFKRYPD